MRIKEIETLDKYTVKDLKKLWKMNVAVMPIVVCTFGTVPEGLEKKLRKLIERNNQDHLDYMPFKSARILRRILEN